MDCGQLGEKRFLRSAVCDTEGLPLGLGGVLEEALQIGQQVQVQLVEEDVVAVCPGVLAEEPASQPDTLGLSGSFHKVRVVELYADETGRHVRGLATIQESQLIKSGGAAMSMMGEWVIFEGSDLYFFRVRLDKADLGLVFSEGENFHCQLDMLEVKEGRAQYRVKLGWKHWNRDHGALVPGRQLAPESTALLRHLAGQGLTLRGMEETLLGRTKLQCKLPPENMAMGTVLQLDPAENNETVCKGLIKISCGPNKGSVIKFNRNKGFLFGQSLEKADLLYLVRAQEPVFCEVSGLADYGEGEYVTQRVEFWRPGAGGEHLSPLEWPQEERQHLMLWLNVHMLTFKELKDVLAGTSQFRYFIPFPRDTLVGRVVAFDPVRGNRFCGTSGTIVVESGSMNLEQVEEGSPGVQDMAGTKVTFHRTCFWVYGRKMAKADLSYVVQPNQRVMLECKAITEEDRQVHPSLPLDISYRASMIWIGASRPRNDRDDPNRNDTSVFNWLGKRGLSMAQFTKLVEGGLPPHHGGDLNCNGFFLSAPYGEVLPAGFPSLHKEEQMPVVR